MALSASPTPPEPDWIEPLQKLVRLSLKDGSQDPPIPQLSFENPAFPGGVFLLGGAEGRFYECVASLCTASRTE
jgi:hypothetical protein